MKRTTLRYPTSGRRSRQARNRRGFTLLEVMLVLVILAAIAAIAVVNIGGMQTRAYKMTASTQIHELKNGLESYKLFVGSYPPTLEAMHVAPSDVDTTKYEVIYKDGIPKDPWGRDYQYQLNGDKYELSSMGADGQPGTGDDITG